MMPGAAPEFPVKLTSTLSVCATAGLASDIPNAIQRPASTQAAQSRLRGCVEVRWLGEADGDMAALESRKWTA